jgi:hypothetical protein
MRKSIFILLTFLSLSCFLMGQWTQGSGMDGGDFRCLAKIGNNIYAGSQYGGVFRSTNNGDSWTPLWNGLPAGVAVTQIMEHDTKLFVGTSYWSLAGMGVYRSDDGGETWVQKNNGIPYPSDQPRLSSVRE